MDFKKLLIVLILLAILPACGPYTPTAGGDEEEDLIGTKLTAVSALSSISEESADSMAIFDETVRKIHVFDMQKMKHKLALTIEFPQEDHYVLHNSSGSFTIDLTKKHISIFDKDGVADHQPVVFFGTPLSAAFRPDLGYMVIYDDLMSVVIIKIDTLGKVEKKISLGPILTDDVSIVSGDINSSAQLLLAMSDNSLAVVDIEATLNSGNWTFTSVVTGLDDIKWLAPSRENPNHILMRSRDKISLFDVGTSTVLSQIDFDPDNEVVKKYSKSMDPHIIVGDKGSWTSTENAKLVYTQGGVIKTRTINKPRPFYMISQLNLISNTWDYVDTAMDKEVGWDYDEQGFWSYNSLNEVRESRRIVQYRFSDQAVLGQRDLPNQARLRVAPDYVFALFPSELGYARRLSTNSDAFKELKLFNLNHIK